MGVYLSQPMTQKKINQGMKKGISFCAAEMQGWRKSMQDAAIHALDIGDGNSLFAVFDGHGGHEVSKFVQKIFINELKSLSDYKDKNYEKALYVVFKRIDELIVSQQGAKNLMILRQSTAYQQISHGTGCTANVVLITKSHFYVANAGDSRSVLCRSGKAVDLSFDHKPESLEEQKRIVNAGGCIQMGRVNGGLNLTRSFGDFSYKQNTTLPWTQQMITCKPDVVKLQRQNLDEYIILGCDGIWEKYVENSQGLINIVNLYIEQKKQNKEIMQTLLNDLLAKDSSMGIGCDNMTAILIRLNQ